MTNKILQKLDQMKLNQNATVLVKFCVCEWNIKYYCGCIRLFYEASLHTLCEQTCTWTKENSGEGGWEHLMSFHCFQNIQLFVLALWVPSMPGVSFWQTWRTTNVHNNYYYYLWNKNSDNNHFCKKKRLLMKIGQSLKVTGHLW